MIGKSSESPGNLKNVTFLAENPVDLEHLFLYQDTFKLYLLYLLAANIHVIPIPSLLKEL